MSIKTQIRIALFYFLVAGAFGVFLRLFHVFDFNVNYRFVVHGHSHIALLGWVYLCITSLLYHFFIPKTKSVKRIYKIMFWFTQSTLVGMLITFPLQGYALFSITFSTLFLFASYWFTWFFFKNVSPKNKLLACYPYVKASLYYLVLSSIGPWALGAIMVTLGATSIWYRLAIYFYLHFQYNGWMLLAVLGILLFFMERGGISLFQRGASPLSRKHNKNIFIVINISVVLTLLLSALWTQPHGFVYGLCAVGAVLQLTLIVYALLWLKKNKNAVQALFTKVQWFLFKTILIVLSLKLILQFLGTLPYFANLSSSIMELTIAYLHWIFLGVISLSLFLLLNINGYLQLNLKYIYFYLTGFLLTEGLLVYKGIAIWSNAFTILDYYNEYLLMASVLLCIAIILIVLKRKTTTT